MHYNVAVIGGGPGGYVSAIKAAQNGLTVCVIEKDRLGGTCLNAGCIPTKYLLSVVQKSIDFENMESLGLFSGKLNMGYANIAMGKDKVVMKLRNGVQYLMRKNKITVISGVASFADPRTLIVGDERITFDHGIIASGSTPVVQDLFACDGKVVGTSDEALDWIQVPASHMVIVGGGVISCEMATIFRKLGCNVTIIELMDSILPGMDTEIQQAVYRNLTAKGISIITSTQVSRINVAQGMAHIAIPDGQVIADKVIVSIGRKACIDGLGLENIGMRCVRSKIEVDAAMKTNVSGIYAIGDVCNSPFDLAHTAMKEGEIAVENILGHFKTMRYDDVPMCVYTIPETASVGVSEKQAMDEGRDIRIGKFSFLANGKAVSSFEDDGFVKIIVDRQTERIIGSQMFGPHVTDLISLMATAIRLGIKADEIWDVVFAHPTLSEAVLEAAGDVLGKAVHC